MARNNDENFDPLIRDVAGTVKYGLDIISITDTREKSLVLHERPFTNLVLSQDMGFRARKIKVDTVWFDNTKSRPVADKGLAPTWGQVYNFIEFLKVHNLIVFQHPTWGPIYGNIGDIEVFEDDSLRQASVKFTFVEEQYTSDKETDVQSIVNRMITLQQQMVDENLNFIKDQVAKDLKDKASQVTNATNYNTTQTISNNLTSAAATVRLYVSKLDSAIAIANNVASTITNPVNSIIDSLVYSTDAIGAVLQPFVKMTERLTLLNETLIATPAKFIEKLNTSINDVVVAVEKLEIGFLTPLIYASAASVAGYYVATTLEEDENTRSNIKSIENIQTFGANGKLSVVNDYQVVMTLDDLELLLAGIKDMYETALGAFTIYLNTLGVTQILLLGGDYRNLLYLKDQSRALQDYVNTIKIQRLSIKEVTITDQPLHMVCLFNNLSYQAAERLLSINPQIKNPTFISGKIKVYA